MRNEKCLDQTPTRHTKSKHFASPREMNLNSKMKIAVVIPSFKVKKHIAGVIAKIGPEVQRIFVVDDLCPEASGLYVQNQIADPRVRVVFNETNCGVGGATLRGYQEALAEKCDIAVKVDGDGQMDPQLISRFLEPILSGQADYTKGNRFFNIDDVRKMPAIRLIGNAVLSFFTKFSSGYYHIFDPTNGFTALRLSILAQLNLEKIAKRYFFESDLLFRLNLINARVLDVPIKAVYGDETSNLKIYKILFPFLSGHLKNFAKRIFYKYYIRDFSIASLEFLLGLALLSFGLCFGTYKWIHESQMGTTATAGTVMLSALPIIIGCQLLLAFFSYDMKS